MMLSRRSIVSAAALIAATSPTMAASPDTALLALREPYERTLADMDVAAGPHNRAERAYFALRKTHPDSDSEQLRKLAGLDHAERAWDVALDANSAVIRQIAELPAHTTEGIIFKARISEREDNMERDLIASIIADLVAMGGAHA